MKNQGALDGGSLGGGVSRLEKWECITCWQNVTHVVGCVCVCRAAKLRADLSCVWKCLGDCLMLVHCVPDSLLPSVCVSYFTLSSHWLSFGFSKLSHVSRHLLLHLIVQRKREWERQRVRERQTDRETDRQRDRDISFRMRMSFSSI